MHSVIPSAIFSTAHCHHTIFCREHCHRSFSLCRVHCRCSYIIMLSTQCHIRILFVMHSVIPSVIFSTAHCHHTIFCREHCHSSFNLCRVHCHCSYIIMLSIQCHIRILFVMHSVIPSVIFSTAHCHHTNFCREHCNRSFNLFVLYTFTSHNMIIVFQYFENMLSVL
jgi:hypothetical protein